MCSFPYNSINLKATLSVPLLVLVKIKVVLCSSTSFFMRWYICSVASSNEAPRRFLTGANTFRSSFFVKYTLTITQFLGEPSSLKPTNHLAISSTGACVALKPIRTKSLPTISRNLSKLRLK